MDFDIPKDIQKYLNELDDFIEKEIIDVDKSSIVDETNNVDKMKTKIWIFMKN